jgi:hypothetical protein
MPALNTLYLGNFASDVAASAHVNNVGWIPANPGSVGRCFVLVAGLTYRNTATGLFRMYTGSVWQEIGGGGGTDDWTFISPAASPYNLEAVDTHSIIVNLTTANLVVNLPPSVEGLIYRFTMMQAGYISLVPDGFDSFVGINPLNDVYLDENAESVLMIGNPSTNWSFLSHYMPSVNGVQNSAPD